MSNIKITPVDEKLEQDGAIGNYRGVKMLIARANNAKFKQLFRKLVNPHKKAIDKGTLDPDTSERIMAEAMAETILLNWKGHPAGIEYSKENAMQLLLEDQDAADFVREFSEDLNNYLNDKTEDTVEK